MQKLPEKDGLHLAANLWVERQKYLSAWLPPVVREKFLKDLETIVLDSHWPPKSIASIETTGIFRSILTSMIEAEKANLDIVISAFNSSPIALDLYHKMHLNLQPELENIPYIGEVRAGYLIGHIEGRGVSHHGHGLVEWATLITRAMEDPDRFTAKRKSARPFNELASGQADWDIKSVKSIRNWAKNWYLGPFEGFHKPPQVQVQLD